MGLDEDDNTSDVLLEGYDDAMVEEEAEFDSGCLSIEVPVEECREWWQPWRRALVVKVLGRRFSFHVLEHRLLDLWGMGGKLEIIDLPNDYFVVCFYSKEQYQLALENGSWMIQGYYITVTKWRLFFATSSEIISSTLTWIRIPKLHVEFFKECFLMRIGNMLGKAIKVGLTTMKAGRGQYARICVDVDLRKPLVSRIKINGRLFNVEYEGLNLICFNCGRYGHAMEDCGKQDVIEKERVMPGKEVETGQQAPFGPWMIATNNRRRRVQQTQEQVEQIDEVRILDMVDRGKAKPNTKQGEWSRFNILTEVDDDTEESGGMAEEPLELLQQNIMGISDRGPDVTFNVRTREDSKVGDQRGKKGITVKEPSKVRVHINQGVMNNEVETSERWRNHVNNSRGRGQGSSYRGRGGSGRGRVGVSFSRYMQDITNNTRNIPQIEARDF